MTDFSRIIRADGCIDHEELKIQGAKLHEEMNERDFKQAATLWKAGWKAESHHEGEDIMSYYWRRPPKRKGKKGRLFLSTNQAHNALKKEAK